MVHQLYFLFLVLFLASPSNWSCEASHHTILHKRFVLQPIKVEPNSSSIPNTTTNLTTGNPLNVTEPNPNQTTITDPSQNQTEGVPPNVSDNSTTHQNGTTTGNNTLTPNKTVLPSNITSSTTNQTEQPVATSTPLPSTHLAIPPIPPLIKSTSPVTPLNTSLSIPPPPPQPDRSCQRVPLTVASWKELQIDNYLKSYPGGSKLNLADFAAQHGAYNFLCGLGESCHAGQLCAPIQGPAWYVLFAAQQYNIFQQALYDAIGFVSTQTSTIGSQLVQEMYPLIHKKKAFHDFRIGMILTMLAAVASSIACAVFMFVPGLQPLAIASASAAALSVASTTALLKSQSEDKKAAKEDPFTLWAHYSEEISQWQTNTQNSLGNQLQSHLSSGISTEEGIYGIIKNGQFGYNVGVQTTTDLEDGYREVVMARMFSEILRSKEAFVTIGSDPCNQGGPNGAFRAEEGWLSFCDSKGVMMNIISAHHDESDNHWPHAVSLTTKYGMTVEYLTQQSIDCQNKFHDKFGFGYDPYTSGSLPNNKNSECLVNLLVCDCRGPGMHHARKKSNTVSACRHHAGIPV